MQANIVEIMQAINSVII